MLHRVALCWCAYLRSVRLASYKSRPYGHECAHSSGPQMDAACETMCGSRIRIHPLCDGAQMTERITILLYLLFVLLTLVIFLALGRTRREDPCSQLRERSLLARTTGKLGPFGSYATLPLHPNDNSWDEIQSTCKLDACEISALICARAGDLVIARNARGMH